MVRLSSPLVVRLNLPHVLRKAKNIFHAGIATIANIAYGRPAKKITTIGVTGTDGKTTTTSLISHILKTADMSPAMITTVGAQIGETEYNTGLHTTTPSSFTLQKYIKRALTSGCRYLVLEVTSHALDQNRVNGIDFKIGVLTNISHEHLDYHKTYENYVNAKSKLFLRSDIAVFNKDDKSYERVLELCKGKKIYTYSLRGTADFNLESIKIPLPPQFDFNHENFLAAVSVAKILGVDDEKIKLALATFKFPEGRQEIVYDGKFRVVIDFAHTPNSFDKVLNGIKGSISGRLIHVFGAAGERDRSKRPLMGSIAAKFDDIIILTSEDPRSEEIESINEQIKLGIKDFKGELVEMPDRQEAINYAVRIAQKGDTIIITGKGHEKSMNLGHGEVAWSDHEAVERVLNQLKTKN